MIENGGNDMALQFILGSARSGKTDFIYDQMIKDSMEHEDEEFFFIVPDQSTLNAQKQLVTRHPRHGTFTMATESSPMNSSPMMKACASPSGLGCTL